MTKTQLYTEVTKLMAEFEDQFKSKKSFNELSTEIDKLLKPKAGGGVTQNPMITIDDINYHYCRYTGFYIPEAEMVMANGKSKGYSKKAITKWTKAGREIQATNEEAMQLLLSGDAEKGKSLALQAEELKTNRNKQSYYDDIRAEYEAIKLETK
jgi:hypothetical protein